MTISRNARGGNAPRNFFALFVLLWIGLIGCSSPHSEQLAKPFTPTLDSAAVAELYCDRAYGEYEPGHLEAALVLYDSAIGFDPKSAHAWHGRGSTLGRLMRHDDAQAAFTRAIELKPDYLMAWWHRGCDNAVAGRRDDALRDLQHAISLDSSVKSWPFSDDCWESLRADEGLQKLTR